MKLIPQITFRSFESSPALLTHIHQKIAWLERFTDKIISCRIVIEKPHKHHAKGNLYHIRIDLRLPQEELVISRGPTAHQAHQDIYVSIRDAFDEARRVLEDYLRKRRKGVKHQPPFFRDDTLNPEKSE